jgi:hypothetical protein
VPDQLKAEVLMKYWLAGLNAHHRGDDKGVWSIGETVIGRGIPT